MIIKKREVIFSITIISLMVMLGLRIAEGIHQDILEDYLMYDTAVQIETEEVFRYGLKTEIGYAFVYGELVALDPVTFPEIGGEYSYVKKEEQEYRRHERVVTKIDKDGKTYTEIEYYWTWDVIHTYYKSASEISFLNVKFFWGKIPFPSAREIACRTTGYHKRNVYYAKKVKYKGTIFTNLTNRTINDTEFYDQKSIDETIEYLESGHPIIWFWFFWVILTAMLVAVFYYFDNRWLD